MSSAHRIELDNCVECPFSTEEKPDAFGDICAHPSAAEINPRFVVYTQPDWCPLRSAETTIAIRKPR